MGIGGSVGSFVARSYPGGAARQRGACGAQVVSPCRALRPAGSGRAWQARRIGVARAPVVR